MSDLKTKYEEQEDRWIQYILSNKNNPSVSTPFKRLGAGKDQIVALSQLYAQGFRYQESIYLLCAYAGFSLGVDGLSFPKACKKLAFTNKSIEGRMTILLRKSKLEEIEDDMYRLIQACISSGIPIDNKSLLKDLKFYEGEYTRKKWAREFWSPNEEGEDK